MVRRKRIFVFGLGAVVLIGTCGVVLKRAYRPDRMIHGRLESEWIRSVTNFNGPALGQWNKLGPEAVPILVEAADYKGGTRAAAYAAIWPKLPGVIRKRMSPPPDYSNFRGTALAWMSGGVVTINTNQFPIVLPLLVRCLEDTNFWVRANAINLLANKICPQMGRERDVYLPAVIRASTDTNMFLRMTAAWSLQVFSNRTDLVFPALTNAMQDYYADVRIRAAMSAYCIDPAWASNSGALDVAYDCVGLTTVYGAGKLARQLVEKIEQSGQPRR